MLGFMTAARRRFKSIQSFLFPVFYFKCQRFTPGNEGLEHFRKFNGSDISKLRSSSNNTTKIQVCDFVF